MKDLPELYKALGLYKPNMTGDEIVKIFLERDLAQYFTDDEEQELSLKRQPIYYEYGEFKEVLNMTHINKMIKACNEHGIDLGIINDTSPVKSYTLKVNLEKMIQSPVTTVRNALLRREIVEDVSKLYFVRRLEKAMEEFERNEPETYKSFLKGRTLLKVQPFVEGKPTVKYFAHYFIPNKDNTKKRSIDPQKRLYHEIHEFFSDEKYSEAFVTLGSTDNSVLLMNSYGTFDWAMNQIKLGYKAHKENNYKDLLIETLRINEGDICLFSIGQFSEVLRTLEDTFYTTKIVTEDDKRIYKDIGVQPNTKIKVLDATSFVLSRVYEITDDYLVLEVSYSSAGSVISRLLPVKWELFYPKKDLYDSSSGSSKYEMLKTPRNQSYRAMDTIYKSAQSLVLLTERNCYSLRHPTERGVPATSLYEHNKGEDIDE